MDDTTTTTTTTEPEQTTSWFDAPEPPSYQPARPPTSKRRALLATAALALAGFALFKAADGDTVERDPAATAPAPTPGSSPRTEPADPDASTDPEPDTDGGIWGLFDDAMDSFRDLAERALPGRSEHGDDGPDRTQTNGAPTDGQGAAGISPNGSSSWSFQTPQDWVTVEERDGLASFTSPRGDASMVLLIRPTVDDVAQTAEQDLESFNAEAVDLDVLELDEASVNGSDAMIAVTRYQHPRCGPTTAQWTWVDDGDGSTYLFVIDVCDSAADDTAEAALTAYETLDIHTRA